MAQATHYRFEWEVTFDRDGKYSLGPLRIVSYGRDYDDAELAMLHGVEDAYPGATNVRVLSGIQGGAVSIEP